MPGTIDDEYYRYLWGEASPQSFASKAKVAGDSRKVLIDPTIDLSKVVSR